MNKLISSILPVLLLSFFSFCPVYGYVFLNDVSGTYFENAINYLVEENIVQGYPDGTYKPSQTINRAELIKIILEASSIDTGNASNNCFPDVSGNDWYVGYVCTAKDLGIVDGYDDGYFRPDRDVNFVESLKIIMLGYRLDTGVSTDPWYKQYVVTASSYNMIPLTVESFGQDLNRGEMADMITRLNKHMDGTQQEYLVSSFGAAGGTVVDFESIEAKEAEAELENYSTEEGIDELLDDIDQLLLEVDPGSDFSDFDVL